MTGGNKLGNHDHHHDDDHDDHDDDDEEEGDIAHEDRNAEGKDEVDHVLMLSLIHI